MRVWRALALVLLLAFAGGCAPPATPTPTPPPWAPTPGVLSWLRTEGNRIVDEAGRTVALRGVNVERRNWIWAYTHSIEYERRAIPVATGSPPDGWGATVVLLNFSSGPVNRGEQDYLRAIDELVALARAGGAYTLLVYRDAEPNAEQPRMPDQAAEDALAALAGRYSDEPAVLYGLQAEPHDVSWADLTPRLVSMIDAARARNPRALISVPGTEWGRHIHWALDSPIPRDNLLYNSHAYDTWDTIRARYGLDKLAARYPVVLGEFGPGQSMTLDDVRRVLDFSESKGISWIAWLFNDEGPPVLLKDRTTFEPTEYGAEVKRRLQAARRGGP